MKDFDHARNTRPVRTELDFQIGGERFRMKPAVRADVLALIEDANGGAEILRAIDQTVLDIIEDGNLYNDDGDLTGIGEAGDRWLALRARNTDPLTLEDLVGLSEWLVAEQTGRPTEPPVRSTNGRSGGGTTSTAISSSPADLMGHPA